MSNRYHKRYVTHPFSSDFFLSYLNTTAITNNTLITDTLILTTVTFEILNWAKDFLAKQSITFGLISPIVNCFRLEYFTF